MWRCVVAIGVMGSLPLTANLAMHATGTACTGLLQAAALDVAFLALSSLLGFWLVRSVQRQTGAELRRHGAALEAQLRTASAACDAAQLRAARAERLQALGQLAGGIAHDFNNVLQTISGSVAAIALRADDDPQIRYLAHLANEAAERGAAITRRLLTFGRKNDLRTQVIEAAPLLQGVREILMHTLGPEIAVVLRVEPDLESFSADRAQLEIALINLAANARDAMPRGGTVTLGAFAGVLAGAVQPNEGGPMPGSYVRLTVEDTGTGMSAATLARVGEPFFTTKPDGAGTGLGLAIVKEFAERSGGALCVQSTPGKGTVAAVWLPVAASAYGTADWTIPDWTIPDWTIPEWPLPDWSNWPTLDAPLVTDASRRPRVLLVDDDFPVRESLAMVLEDAGFSVLPAASGSEAIDLLSADQTVEALVTDLSMSGMGGLDVIRAMHERRPGLPAVLLTGYAASDAELTIDEAECGGFTLLRKSATGQQITRHLGALLAGR